MVYSIFNKIHKLYNFQTASAHCDIPCKIYDPMHAQISVLTMIRICDLIKELEDKDSNSVNDKAQFSRLISQKEEHGIKVKDEIRVIWGDYIKEPQLEKFPELHKLTHDIMLNTSKAKQEVNKEITIDLLKKVNRFAEIFWTTKDIKTYKAICPYPPAQELIYPDLKE